MHGRRRRARENLCKERRMLRIVKFVRWRIKYYKVLLCFFAFAYVQRQSIMRPLYPSVLPSIRLLGRMSSSATGRSGTNLKDWFLMTLGFVVSILSQNTPSHTIGSATLGSRVRLLPSASYFLPIKSFFGGSSAKTPAS